MASLVFMDGKGERRKIRAHWSREAVVAWGCVYFEVARLTPYEENGEDALGHHHIALLIARSLAPNFP